MTWVDETGPCQILGLAKNYRRLQSLIIQRRNLGRDLSKLRQRIAQQIFVADYLRPKLGPGERNGITLRKRVFDIRERVLSWTVPVLLQHCGGWVLPRVMPLHIMKIGQKRVGRMAYCRENDRLALDQPSDKALAREEMLMRDKTWRKIVCASRSPLLRQFDNRDSIGLM